ncbi:MAG: DUF4339 domain-containing protein [Planctomycetaceae bacterium]|jgi:hypothetical protein|nr:DUF4339 domain-containing protein [Planctomycetaceae bacterium]
MSNDYYINTIKGKQGPFSLEQLKQFVERGTLKENNPISSGDTGLWIRANTIPGLFIKEPDQPQLEVNIQQSNIEPSTPAVPVTTNTTLKQKRKTSMATSDLLEEIRDELQELNSKFDFSFTMDISSIKDAVSSLEDDISSINDSLGGGGLISQISKTIFQVLITLFRVSKAM